jgi:hypothetical protein
MSSAAGEEIQAFVRKPLADPPVGYQSASLENYTPNETAYISEVLKKHLNQLGRTPDSGAMPGHMPAKY